MADENKKSKIETVRIRVPLGFKRRSEPPSEPLTIKPKTTAPEKESGKDKSQDKWKVRDLFCQQLLENIYDGLLITDIKGTVLEANQRAAVILGYSKEEFVGRKVIDFIDGADESLLTVIEKNVARERFTMVEGFCQRLDGSEFPAEVTVNVIRLPDQKLLCFFIRDITKRMELEIELLRLSKAVESAGDAISISDELGNHIYQNPAFTEMCGFSLYELNALGGISKIYADNRRMSELISTVEEKGGWSGEIEVLQRGTRRKIPVFLRANAIRDEDGDLIGLISVHTDMTEQKRAERALRKAHDELEQRVLERTEELVTANERLKEEVTVRKQAEDSITRYANDLERSNQELQQFAYVASHDLQEPLRAVVSYLQLLQRRCADSLDSDGSRYIDRSVAAGKRMQNLIRDLLAYSRVGTHGSPFTAVNMRQVVESAIENLRVSIEETDAVIEYDDLPDDEVVCDPSQMEQLFQNLIGNAIKFRGDAPPRVTISAQTVTPEDQSEQTEVDAGWIFCVQDNGIGIEKEFQERIFRIFQRLHTIDEHPGTGIGLAICRKIVERHGGDIWVESGLHDGSEFCFSIPLLNSDNPVKER